MSGAGRRVSVLVALAAIGACALSAARAEAAPAGPVWSLRIISFPTNFSPNSVATGAGGGGPGYQIVATNIGDSRTTGSFEIVATLPPGVTVAPPLTPAEAPVIPRPESTYGREHVKQTEEPTLSCLVAGQMVTCTGVDPGVGAGERAQLTIPVKLETSLPETIEAEATVSGGGAAPASATVKTKVLSTPAPFDFLEGSAGFGGGWTEADGSASTQAGSHPFQIGIGLGFPSDPAEAGQGSVLTAGGGLRDASVTLPAGVAVNPQATLKCLEPELESESCPEASQVGTVRLILSLGAMPAAGTRQLYNMAAPPGSPGEFGFEVLEGTYVHLLGHVRSDGDYELSAGASDVLAKVTVLGVETTLWGNPSDSSHDGVRGACLFTLSKSESTSTCPVTRTNKALLTLPTSCTGPLSTTASADSWLEPGVFHGRAFETSAMQGCSALEFDPTIALTPDTSAADSPAGLTVCVHIPQNEEFENEAEEPQLAEAHLKDAKVTLPAGVTINPSAANGRGACSAAQIGLTTPVGQAAHPGGDDGATVEAGALGDRGRPDVAVGEDDRVGGDDPAVEGLVAHEPHVEVHAGDLGRQRLELAPVGDGGRVVDAHRPDDVERRAALGEAAERGGGAVEALVRLQEPDAHEDVPVGWEAERGAGGDLRRPPARLADGRSGPRGVRSGRPHRRGRPRAHHHRVSAGCPPGRTPRRTARSISPPTPPRSPRRSVGPRARAASAAARRRRIRAGLRPPRHGPRRPCTRGSRPRSPPRSRRR